MDNSMPHGFRWWMGLLVTACFLGQWTNGLAQPMLAGLSPGTEAVQRPPEAAYMTELAVSYSSRSTLPALSPMMSTNVQGWVDACRTTCINPLIPQMMNPPKADPAQYASGAVEPSSLVAYSVLSEQTLNQMISMYLGGQQFSFLFEPTIEMLAAGLAVN